MSARFFLVFVSLCWSATYADPRTSEQKQVAKECAGVPSERVEALREFVRKQSKDASHGHRVTEARAWAKPAKDEGVIPDGCIVGVVREVLATEKRAKEELQAEAQRKREALARSEWDQLTEAERAWVMSCWTTQDPPIIDRSGIGVGAIGVFGYGVVLNVIQVLSESSFLAKIDSIECEFGVCLDSKTAMFVGVDTSGMVTGVKLRPQGRYWITGTTTYPRAMGGTNTVYLVRSVALDTDKLERLVPYMDAIIKGAKQP